MKVCLYGLLWTLRGKNVIEATFSFIGLKNDKTYTNGTTLYQVNIKAPSAYTNLHRTNKQMYLYNIVQIPIQLEMFRQSWN